MLALYALASGMYRIVVSVSIILFIGHKFLLVGLLMALLCALSWGIVPMPPAVTSSACSIRGKRLHQFLVGDLAVHRQGESAAEERGG